MTQVNSGVGLATPIAIEVVRNGLGAIADEMAITHVRAAYSSVVREILDFSTAVCDGRGRVVAQGLSLALQLGAIPRFMRYLLEGVGVPSPGDVYLLNHPWLGGVHLPDFFFAKPVYTEGIDEPLAYTVIVSHVVDVGGRFPGGVSTSATSLWDEGLVLPAIPLIQSGVLNQALLYVIAANSRNPAKVLGDVRAALAGLETGSRQFRDLAARLGAADLKRYMDELLDATERATRAAITALPDGTGTASDCIDNDGNGSGPIEFVCRADKRGDRLSFDFTGTAEQVSAGINCTFADVMSSVTFAARAALGEDLAVNDGFCRCLEVVAPEGSIINAAYPAAVGARALSIYRMTDVAMAALGSLVPDRIPANDGGPAVMYISGAASDGSQWIFLDYVQAGWGATAASDGVPGVSHPISNAANIPVEIIEQEYPLRIVQYGLLPDTAGAGTFLGAPAVIREYEILANGTTVNFRLDRQLHPPPGRAGGCSGTPSRCLIRRARGDWKAVPCKGTATLNRGDAMRIELASGGGYGNPALRDPARVDADVQAALVTVPKA